jgi:hypothetical protein
MNCFDLCGLKVVCFACGGWASFPTLLAALRAKP